MDTRRWMAGVAAVAVLAWHAESRASWRQWRQGPTREALAPVPLGIGAPGVRWRLPTGGGTTQVHITDLDGDGGAELLSLEGGRVVARRLHGGVLWDTPPVKALEILDAGDLDGHPGVEVLVRTQSTALLVDGASGALLWQSPASLATSVALIRLGDLQGDGTPELGLVDNSVNVGTDGTVSVFTFPNGAASGTLALQTGPACEGEPGRVFAFGDVDGDGVQDVVTSGRQRICAWSGTTGALLGTSAPVPDPMATGELQAADVDGDGRVEVFAFTDWTLVDHASRRIYAFRWQSGAFTLAWTRSPADPATARHRWSPEPLVDADGDGALDVVTSFREGGTWTGLVLDAATGKPRATLPGRVLLGHSDADGDGVRELLAAATTSVSPPPFADKELVALSGGAAPAVLASLPGALVRLGPFPAPFPAGDLLAARDTDGDSIAEALELRTLGAQDPVATVPLEGALSAVHALSDDGEPGVAVLYASGEVAALDEALALRNDADGDGHGDLTYGGYQAGRVVGVDEGAPALLVPRAGNRITLVAAGEGTPLGAPPVLTEAAGNLAQRPLLLRLGALGDGFAVLRRLPDGSTSVDVLTAAGAPVSTTDLGGPGGTLGFPIDPLVWDGDGDGTDELYLLASDAAFPEPTHVLLAVDALGGLRWPPLAINTAGSSAGGIAALTVGPYAPALLLTASKRRVAVGATTGQVVYEGEGGVTHYLGQPIQTDLDGDDHDEVLLTGTHHGALALESDLTVRWEAVVGDALRGAGAVVPAGDATVVALAHTSGAELSFVDGATGEVVGAVTLVGGAQVDAKDLDPDQAVPTLTDVIPALGLGPAKAPGFVAAADDGALYAVTADRTLVWSTVLGGALGSPAIVDVDQDGVGEVAVPVGTGELVVVDQATVEPTAWVRENDGSAPALTDAADIDAQEAADRIHVNWAPVDGAGAWIVRVWSPNGTLVAERQVDGALTGTTVDGLTLQPGLTYRTGVSAVATGADASAAAEVLSDGVTIVDGGAPEILALSAAPDPFTPDGDGQDDSTTITASAHDPTRIAAWELTVWSGSAVASWSGAVGETELELAVPWDGTAEGEELPTGTYAITLTVTDISGHETLAATTVTLCRPPFDGGPCAEEPPPGEDAGPTDPEKPDPQDAGVLGEPDAGAGDAGGSAGGVGEPGSLPSSDEAPACDQGGCSCDQSGARPADAAPWLAIALLWLLTRRRSA